ncbi:HGGxSTG domain-containing protein [Zhihengliuella flava]|uniref:Uncharacterized protein n=1 Tax=Zhihengliuella flava TaxID=1285193 RepID=A0A931DCD2_9MICC|nr:hypothetical protein [Zhihengliuella flava]
MADPKYAPGQTRDGKAICGARKRNDDPCGAPPIKGGTRCGKHGGRSPQVMRKAEKNLAEQDLAKQVRTLGIQDKYPDVDPGQALLREIQITHAHVEWLRGKVEELTPRELVWGETQHKAGIGKEGPIDEMTSEAKPSVWYELYERERERLVKFSAIALKAGIEERRVRLAEQQGELVAGVLKRILDGLNLTPEQWELTQTIVPTELRALEGNMP